MMLDDKYENKNQNFNIENVSKGRIQMCMAICECTTFHLQMQAEICGREPSFANTAHTWCANGCKGVEIHTNSGECLQMSFLTCGGNVMTNLARTRLMETLGPPFD